MNVIVCLKPVKNQLVYPLDGDGQEMIINPFDLYALTQIIELKKRISCKICCICMGGITAKPMMHRAIAMGADECYLISDSNFAGSDTVATSYILSSAIRFLGNADLIVCGAHSIDGETGQVVYGLGERLNYYCISNLMSIEDITDDDITFIHKTGNRIVRAQAKLPLVVSFADFEMEKPIINLLALKRAKSAQISILDSHILNVDLNCCGIDGSKTKVVKISESVQPGKEKEIIDGTVKDKVEWLSKIIKGIN